MNHTQAKKYLARAQKYGYVPYHSGIVSLEEGGKIVNHGINLDGDGHDGRLFGCPFTIWDAADAERRFPPTRSR